jgi:hypothetical protein
MEPNLCKCWIGIKGISRFDASWDSAEVFITRS